MSEQPAKDTASRGPQLPVKWIVIGVVIIAFMLIFKSELGGLLERTTDVKITTSGVEIKTLDTPIGQTQVSVVPVSPEPQATTGIRNTTYTDTQYGFQISWPNNREWTADQDIGRQLLGNMALPATVDIPIAIISNNVVDNFRPNVNVVVEKVGQMGIEEYIELSKQTLRAQGWQLLSSSVDSATNGGVIVLINNSFGQDLYQFQRYAMGNGNAYVVTASQVPQGDLTQGLKDDLSSIINSFRVIK